MRIMGKIKTNSAIRKTPNRKTLRHPDVLTCVARVSDSLLDLITFGVGDAAGVGVGAGDEAVVFVAGAPAGVIGEFIPTLSSTTPEQANPLIHSSIWEPSPEFWT